MAFVKKLLVGTLKVLLILYVLVCILLYFFQEKILFLPDKLGKDYMFNFYQPFEELNIPTRDNNVLNGLLFTSPRSKGLVFYLHGNAGALDSWGDVAKRYTDLNYDVFILDYPGYGKSTGTIKSQSQLLEAIALPMS